MRPRRHPDLLYKQVAEVYVEAFEETHDTASAVMHTWGVNRTTACRWIKRARELGYLGPRPVRCACRCPVHCPHPVPKNSRTVAPPDPAVDAHNARLEAQRG